MMLMVIVLLIAPLTAYLPIAAMGGVILIVAYNLIDLHHIGDILRYSRSETSILLTTFLPRCSRARIRDLPRGIVVAVDFPGPHLGAADTGADRGYHAQKRQAYLRQYREQAAARLPAAEDPGDGSGALFRVDQPCAAAYQQDRRKRRDPAYTDRRRRHQLYGPGVREALVSEARRLQKTGAACTSSVWTKTSTSLRHARSSSARSGRRISSTPRQTPSVRSSVAWTRESAHSAPRGHFWSARSPRHRRPAERTIRGQNSPFAAAFGGGCCRMIARLRLVIPVGDHQQFVRLVAQRGPGFTSSRR